MIPVCVARTEIRAKSKRSRLIHYQSSPPSTYNHNKKSAHYPSQHLNHRLSTPTSTYNSGDSLHNSPPLLFLLLLGAHTHHLAVISHGSSGLVHVAFESTVEPAADHAGRVPRHFGVAGAALAVVFAAALVGSQVVEEALGGGGGLW